MPFAENTAGGVVNSKPGVRQVGAGSIQGSGSYLIIKITITVAQQLCCSYRLLF